MEIQIIEKKIFEIRGHKVMLDFDLAALYQAETKVLNQSVKRNIKRFPEDFMFRLTNYEQQGIKVHSVAVPESGISLRSQIVTASQNTRNISVNPYAFTEQGVAMLSGILNSDIAINMNEDLRGLKGSSRLTLNTLIQQAGWLKNF